MCFYNIQTITLTYIYKNVDDGRGGEREQGRKSNV